MILYYRPKELKYNLAERIRTRTYQTLENEDDIDNDTRQNDHSYRSTIKLRRKKVILERDDDPQNNDDEYDNENDATINKTRNNTIASTTNYLTAATGNKNTRIKTVTSPISSARESAENND